MVRIISSPNRGNSPKMGFLKNFHIAFAKGDRKFITKSVTDTFVLDMIGDKKFEGKEKFVEELKNIPAHKISQLTLDKILSYAVNGMMKLENGKTYAFSDLYTFPGAKGVKIQSLTSYVIELTEALKTLLNFGKDLCPGTHYPRYRIRSTMKYTHFIPTMKATIQNLTPQFQVAKLSVWTIFQTEWWENHLVEENM